MAGRMSFCSMQRFLAATALVLGAMGNPAFAQPADAAASSAVTALSVEGMTVTAQLPCEAPVKGPTSSQGSQSRVCIMGDGMFVLALAVGADDGSTGPMSPDFDAAFDELEGSRDTLSAEKNSVNGRRTMTGSRGPDPAFGLIHAIELRDDAVAYAVTLTRPGLKEALPAAEKARMQAFVDSLEVTP